MSEMCFKWELCERVKSEQHSRINRQSFVAIKLLVKVEVKEKWRDSVVVRPFNRRHFVDYGYGIVCWHISQILWCFETLNKGEN